MLVMAPFGEVASAWRWSGTFGWNRGLGGVMVTTGGPAVAIGSQLQAVASLSSEGIVQEKLAGQVPRVPESFCVQGSEQLATDEENPRMLLPVHTMQAQPAGQGASPSPQATSSHVPCRQWASPPQSASLAHAPAAPGAPGEHAG